MWALFIKAIHSSNYTQASGGPPLIFDHQMAMDSDAQILYVFGGRVVDGDWNKSKYAGLYSYNVSTSKWKSLQYVFSPLFRDIF